MLKNSNTKFYFNCDCKHEFKSSLNNINQNKWCPYCKNKTEKIIFEKLITYYPNLIHQYKVEWCKNKTYLPFDFAIENKKIIIELDGRQHFEQVNNWRDPIEQQSIDKYKMNCAINNCFSIIRLLQEDVIDSTYDWFNELKYNIENIKSMQIIFMCKNNEYTNFYNNKIKNNSI